jgi:hypothetical protein
LCLNRLSITHNFLLGDEVKVRRTRFDVELHDSSLEVVHVKRVDDLIAIWIVGRADIDDFPVEDA